MLLHIKLTGLSDAPLGFKIRRASFLISKFSSKKVTLTVEVPANWELNIRPKRKKRTEKFWRSYHQSLQRLYLRV